MKNDLFIKQGISIPDHELEIIASRSGGPGGQHVNKTSSRITVRWNVQKSHSIPVQVKERIIEKLYSLISSDGYLIVHNSSSRSQQQNKEAALQSLALLIRKAIYIPKKRIPTKISAAHHEVRLQRKMIRSKTKKMRHSKIGTDE
jgi:ribosome-associated protein